MREFILGKEREIFQQKKFDPSQALESSEWKGFTANIQSRDRLFIIYTRDKERWTNTDIRLEATTGKIRASQERIAPHNIYTYIHNRYVKLKGRAPRGVRKPYGKSSTP